MRSPDTSVTLGAMITWTSLGLEVPGERRSIACADVERAAGDEDDVGVVRASTSGRQPRRGVTEDRDAGRRSRTVASRRGMRAPTHVVAEPASRGASTRGDLVDVRRRRRR